MKNEQDELERTISTLEYMLRNGRFDEVDDYLFNADINTLAPRTVLGILTISSHAKEKLKNLQEFICRAEKYFERCIGFERADKLISARIIIPTRTIK